MSVEGGEDYDEDEEKSLGEETDSVKKKKGPRGSNVKTAAGQSNRESQSSQA